MGGTRKDSVEALDVDSARELTARIKSTSSRLSELLLQANEGRAWISLGYHTWEAYARSEFGISRSRSYELLDHARVMRRLREETGLSAIPDINVHMAGLVKPRLPEVIEAIRQQVVATPPDEAVKAAMVVLERARDERALQRTMNAAPRKRREPGSALTVLVEPSEPTLIALVEAIGHIASMPGIDESWAERCTQYAYLRADVVRAVRWLNQLLDAMSPRGVVALAQ